MSAPTPDAVEAAFDLFEHAVILGGRRAKAAYARLQESIRSALTDLADEMARLTEIEAAFSHNPSEPALNATRRDFIRRVMLEREEYRSQLTRLGEDKALVEKALGDVMQSMRLWGAEEDGIPDDITTGAWSAYAHAKCVLCPSRVEYRCTEHDRARCGICEPCAVCGKIRKHNWASFFVQIGESDRLAVTCNDTCARKYVQANHMAADDV